MIQIIPAIDIIDGKCVRLTQGDYALATIYSSDPVEVAKRFEGHGITRLHMVDLDGARLGKVVNLECLYQVASHTSLSIDFGGGVKTEHDVRCVLDNGAEMINVGSIAYKEPDTLFSWSRVYGWPKILLGADVKEKKIVINGWKDLTDIDIIAYIGTFYDKGLRQMFCTDVAKDGMLEGPSIQLYKDIIAAYPEIQLIASGGVSGINDIDELEGAGCSAVIIGKAIYEGYIQIEDLIKYMY